MNDNLSGTYKTVNSSAQITVSMDSISHIIEHIASDDSTNSSSTWIHFQSGKSVHVAEPYKDVQRTFLSSIG